MMNPLPATQWQGKKVAFLGDSITDATHVGTDKNYWQFLQDFLGIEPLVFGINGQTWKEIPAQAQALWEAHGDAVDAIMVFAGTNDYNSSVPIGEWWSTSVEEANYDGTVLRQPRRHLLLDTDTLRGRVNIAMRFMKERFPRQQIILLTPIHRGFATFGETNVQPEESFPNAGGLYLEAYIAALKEAGNVWAVPVIDLHAVSGLYPLAAAHNPYFHLADTDLLHPSAEGHRRMALAMLYPMLALPPDFK